MTDRSTLTLRGHTTGRTTAVPATCAGCHAAATSARLPRGWHRHGTEALCGDCWGERYMLRAITIPVAAPVEPMTWPALRPILDDAWTEARRLGNWALRQLALADEAQRVPGERKIPRTPTLYLYGLAAQSYDRWTSWAGSKGAANCILRAAEQRYRAERYEVWRGMASLPSYRDDLPYPLDADQWSALIDEAGHLCVTLALPGGRVGLRLRGGAGFRRQRRAVQQCIDGQAIAGEAAIYQRRRASGPPYLAVKLALWLPRPSGTRRDEDRVLVVRTGPTALWIAQPSWREEPWRLNADWMRARIAGHAAWRQRRAEDLKHEKRWPERVRAQMVADGETRLQKQQQRLDSFLHESTAALAGFAARNRVSRVIYDERDHSWCEGFAWYMLRQRLAYKLHERRIDLTDGASGEVAAIAPEPLAGGNIG